MCELSPAPHDHTTWMVQVTTEIIDLEFVSNMSDLLAKSENTNPTMTATYVCQLPATHQLQERFAMTFSGPEARSLAQLMFQYYATLADHLRAKRNAS